MAKDKITKLADELEKVMHEIDDVEAEVDARLKPLKEKEEEVRTALMIDMDKKGWKFAKTTSGLGFGVNERKSLTIKEGAEKDAVEWAQKEYPHILTVQKPAMNKILKPMLQLPSFIEETITRYLSVRQTEE